MNETLEDIDTRFLLIMQAEFNQPDRCEGNHYEIECSGKVVARLHNTCGDIVPRKVCQNTVDYVHQFADWECECGRLAGVCWKLMPL